MKPQKTEKGFTLVEIIVSMLIASIIMVFAASFFFTGEKMFSNAISGNTNKIMGDNIMSFVSERLKYSNKLEVRKSSDITTAKYKNVLWINSANKLGFKTASKSDDNIYGDDFYDGNIVSLIITPLENNCLNIQVRVINSDGTKELYSTSNVIKLLNMDISKTNIELSEGTVGTSFVNPVVSFENSGTVSEETPFEDYIWNEELLSYSGGSYSLKLEKDKIYSYKGKYYRAESNSQVNGSSSFFPAPTDGKFRNHFTEVTKP